MAAGDITFYNKLLQAKQDQSTLSSMPVDFDTDTLKLIVLDNTHTPDTGDASAQEHLDDISADEVTTAGGYTGAITLTTVAVSAPVSSVVSVSADVVTITSDVSGFADGRYAVIYKDSGAAATSPLICLIDFGSDQSIVANDFQFNWGSGSGVIFTVTQV